MAALARARQGHGGGRLHLPGQPAAVRVAQDDSLCAGTRGGGQHLERVRRIGGISIEEVLGVEDDAAAVRAQVRHAVCDQAQVLVERRAQHLAHVQGRALAEDGAHRRAGLEQRRDAGVVLDRDAGAASGAERGQAGVRPLLVACAGEQLGVLRVGAGPAALDDGHADAIEPARDAQLVGARQRDPLALGAVAQRRVVDQDVGRIRTRGGLHGMRSPARARGGSPARRHPRAGSAGRTDRWRTGWAPGRSTRPPAARDRR